MNLTGKYIQLKTSIGGQELVQFHFWRDCRLNIFWVYFILNQKQTKLQFFKTFFFSVFIRKFKPLYTTSLIKQTYCYKASLIIFILNFINLQPPLIYRILTFNQLSDNKDTIVFQGFIGNYWIIIFLMMDTKIIMIMMLTIYIQAP